MKQNNKSSQQGAKREEPVFPELGECTRNLPLLLEADQNPVASVVIEQRYAALTPGEIAWMRKNQ